MRASLAAETTIDNHSKGRPHRWYHSTVGLIIIAAAILGFAPSLLYPANRNAPVTTLAVLQAAISTGWVVLYIVQSFLVATGRRVLHRRLGIAGAALAVAVVIVGYFTVVELTRRGFDLSGDLNVKADPVREAVFPMGDLASFATLVAAGLWHRRRPELHKRFMTLGTVGGMMPAVLAHIVGHNLRSMTVLLVPIVWLAFFSPAIYDRLRFGRFHRVTLWGGILLFLWSNVRAAVIAPSAAWHAFMGWAVG